MRGFLLSLDAMVAVIILVTFAAFLGGIMVSYTSPQSTYQRMYYAGKDVLHIIENARISDLQEIAPVDYYISTGLLTSADMNKTLLDIIGALWSSGNITEAENITTGIIGTLLNETRYNYSLSINDQPVITVGISAK